jgi:hypothetical protein
MRCCFIRGGHIADVDKLAEFSDEEAIAKAHALFSERTLEHVSRKSKG